MNLKSCILTHQWDRDVLVVASDKMHSTDDVSVAVVEVNVDEWSLVVAVHVHTSVDIDTAAHNRVAASMAGSMTMTAGLQLALRVDLMKLK